jgi:hypothetical protein
MSIVCLDCGIPVKDGSFCSLSCKQDYMEDLLETDLASQQESGHVTSEYWDNYELDDA